VILHIGEPALLFITNTLADEVIDSKSMSPCVQVFGRPAMTSPSAR
jgi:hypothetical protein